MSVSMTRAAIFQACAPTSVRYASLAEINSWDTLIQHFDHRRVFHTRAWIRSIESFAGVKAIYLVVERGDHLVGCFPGFLRRIGPVRIFCSPMEGWQTESMGPLFNPSVISTAEFMDVVVSFLENKERVHHIEFSSNFLDGRAMVERGFQGYSLSTQRVQLFPGNEDAALKRMKSNARNHLRRAIKLGALVQVETDESFVAECYDQTREVFTRRGNGIPFSENRLGELFRWMSRSGNLLAMSVRIPQDNARIAARIATGVFLLDGKELVLWCWTHRTRYRSYSPTELLTWTAMQKGMEAGCTTFDMTGGGEAKEKFGAAFDGSNMRWVRSRYKWIAKARRTAKRIYRYQQRLRGHLRRQFQSLRQNTGHPDESDS